MKQTDQEKERLKSLKELKGLGINPYPPQEFKCSTSLEEIIKDEENFIDKNVVVAGRIMSFRIMGKASFAELKSERKRLQIYLRRDDLCPDKDKTMYNTVFKKLLDIGDFIGVEGRVFKTQRGELSIWVSKFTLLAKSLRPLPIVKKDADGIGHDIFTDKEIRYRRRYVDLIVNDEIKDIFIKRSQIIQFMRNYFNSRGHIEVETPILQPIPGGASAKPFATHHNSLNIPLYLRIANELYLKRLIVGGFNGVYEFSKNFRNEGMDRTHNPEFTALEIYVAYKDYLWMMDFTEDLLKSVCEDVLGKRSFNLDGQVIDLSHPFKRITFRDSLIQYGGIDCFEKSDEDLRKYLKNINIEVDPKISRTKLLDEIFGEVCEKELIHPTFITDYPKEMSPLCKEHRENNQLTERFELFINGKEIANSYSELNDPIEQRNRFEEQAGHKNAGDDEAMCIDQDFLRALEYGMPPTGGLGIGVDRLVMCLTNNRSIQEVLFFPQMKPK